MIRTLPLLLLSTSLCDLLKGPYGDGSVSDTDPGSTSEVTGDADDAGMTLPTGEPTTGQDDPEPVCLMNPIVGSTDGNFLELCEILVDPHDDSVVVVGAFRGTLEIQGQSVESKPDQRAIFVARFAASGVIEWIESFDEPGLIGCKDAVLTAAGDVAIVDADTARILVLQTSAEPRLWKPIELENVPNKIEIFGDNIVMAGSCPPDNLWIAIADPGVLMQTIELCHPTSGAVPRTLAVDPTPPGSAWVGATRTTLSAFITRVNLSTLEISDFQTGELIPSALSVGVDTVYSMEFSSPHPEQVRLKSYPYGTGPEPATIAVAKLPSRTDMMLQNASLVFALEKNDGSGIDLLRVTADDFTSPHAADIAGEPDWAGPPIVTASPCGVLFGGSRGSSPEPFTVEGAEVLPANAPTSSTTFFVTQLRPNFGE